MEELLASQTKNLTHLYRGLEIEGEVVLITDKEVILDLGTKSEGILPLREIAEKDRTELKIGSKLKAFVILPENENGQTILSLVRQTFTHLEGARAHFRGGKSRGSRFVDWSKFHLAQSQKTKLQGTVLEVNKGGLIVEVGETRGFLPNSQVGFGLLSKASKSMEDLVGQKLTVTIIEIDQTNNKLIFSERGEISEEIKSKLSKFKKDQKVAGKIVAVLPFGLVINVEGVEGLVFISDVSWERTEDLSKDFQTGKELPVLVLGVDEELGRLNLSIKQLIEDPFAEISKKFPADEVVKGEITGISDTGVSVALSGAEGLLLASKMDPDTKYEAGKSMSFLVDSVDIQKRKVNLAPFVTSTTGLIYK
ncbi:MAG: S1 RNA-binding domain-containing protein [Candidatus Daviesbacteria bacterium]|nr:S1 RNA-binding domain-containing protein [Candidatus Daviesbacteria bacterium]